MSNQRHQQPVSCPACGFLIDMVEGRDFWEEGERYFSSPFTCSNCGAHGSLYFAEGKIND